MNKIIVMPSLFGSHNHNLESFCVTIFLATVLIWALFSPSMSTFSFRISPWQSGPDAFEKSRFIMTFLTIVGVTEILCSFRLVLEEKTSKDIPESSRAKFLGSNGLFCFISIWRFGRFKNSFAMITRLSELCLRIRRFIPLVQMKKVISMNYSSSTSSWKPWG